MMIAKTTLCLIVITTMCQTAIQFARGDDCCNCCQNTDLGYIGRLSALIIHLSRPVYNSSFENFEEAQRGDRLKMRIFEFRDRIPIFERNTNIRTFVDILIIFVQLIASEDKNFMMIIQFVMRGSVLRSFPVLVEY